MTEARQHVLGYGRVSTEEQESNYSMDAQRTRFETLVKQNRWISLGFFPETGSGTSVLKRPVLCKLLERIRQGGVEALWVKETDRLSRPENLGDLSIISQTLESSNTHLIVETRVLDLAEDNSVLMLDFEGVLAKHFRRQLLRNMDRGKTRKAEMGRKTVGFDIYGYRTNDSGEYSPDPEEAKVVRLIYELVTRGFSIRKVGAELERRGIRTKHGFANWQVGQLSQILRNEMYLGIYKFRRFKRRKDSDGTDFRVQHESPIVVGSREKPNHPPIIEPGVFDAVQEKLRTNRIATSMSIHMATGLLRCAHCGARTTVRHSNGPAANRGKTIAMYACTNRPVCPSRRIPCAATDQRLWDALVLLFIDPERIHSLIAVDPGNSAEALKKKLAGVEREQKTLAEKQARLLNLYLDGNLPQASYVVKNSELETEGRRIAAGREDLEQRIRAHGKHDLSEELIKTLRLLARSHQRFTESQKTKVFRSIVKEAHLTAHDAELELYVIPTKNTYGKHLQERRDSAVARTRQPLQTIRIRAVQAKAAVAR